MLKKWFSKFFELKSHVSISNNGTTSISSADCMKFAMKHFDSIKGK